MKGPGRLLHRRALVELEHAAAAEEGALLETPAGRVDRYGVALILIATTIAVVFSLAEATWGSLLALALGGGTLLFVLTTSDARPGVVHAMRILVALTLVAAALAALVGTEAQVRATTFLAGGALAFIAPIAIIRRLRLHTMITAHTVFGALCLYLLSGLFFAYVYAFVGVVAPPAFAQEAQPALPDTVYFSFVTLATVGYGDVTPGSQPVRMLAIFEAIGGQLYLVAGVAVLVSNMGRSRREADAIMDADEPAVAEPSASGPEAGEAEEGSASDA